MTENARQPSDRAGTFADRDVLSFAPLYAVDAVSDAEMQEIEAYLTVTERSLGRRDAATRREFNSVVRELREAMSLASASTQVTAPSGLRSRVLDALDGVIQETSADVVATSNVVSINSRRRTWAKAVSIAAAAVVIAVGGVTVAQQMQPDNSSNAVPAVALPSTSTSSVPVMGGGTITVQYSRTTNSAVIALQDVPLPTAGNVYQMWLLDGPPHSIGVVTGDDVVRGKSLDVSGLGKATSFAMTVEPAGGSETPTTTPIAFVALGA